MTDRPAIASFLTPAQVKRFETAGAAWETSPPLEAFISQAIERSLSDLEKRAKRAIAERAYQKRRAWEDERPDPEVA